MSFPWPRQIAPDLAPGGVVIDTWIGGERLRQTAIPAAEVETAGLHGAADAAFVLASHMGRDVALAIYDGDTGWLFAAVYGDTEAGSFSWSLSHKS